MAKHATSVVAEFHFEGGHGVAHWVGVISRADLKLINGMTRGHLDFGDCFGKAHAELYRDIASVRSQCFRVLSEARNDVMAWEHALRVANRKYVGNVDFLKAALDAHQQNEEERRELDGTGGDSEPEDTIDVMGFGTPVPCRQVTTPEYEESEPGSDDDPPTFSPAQKRVLDSDDDSPRRKRIVCEDDDDE